MAPLGVSQRPGTRPVPVESQPAVARAGVGYEPAAEGKDLDRLVAVTDDARSQLVHRALNDSPPDTTAGVRHAIASSEGVTRQPEASDGHLQPHPHP